MMISPAYAQTAGATASGGASAIFVQMLPLLLIFVIFWVLLIRPQQNRMKQQRAKIDAVKKGDGVVTGGGIVGKVIKTDDETVEVEIAQGVKIKVVKATLADVTPNGITKPAND